MNLIPGLSLRATEEAELMGIDEAEIGEFAYDFVEKERDYTHEGEIHGHGTQVMEGQHYSGESSSPSDSVRKGGEKDSAAEMA